MAEKQKNVMGEDLDQCGCDPMTGYFRDGCCNTDAYDRGSHTVCAILTDEFLQFSLSRGNDLITPRPEYDFPGLKAGDSWCLCASRWLEAEAFYCAPPVKLSSTNIAALERVDLEMLKRYSHEQLH